MSVSLKWLGFTAILVLGLCSASFADILEIKGKGTTSGKVLSENDKEVVYKDIDGVKHRVPKKDVEMVIRERSDSTAMTKKILGKIKPSPAPVKPAASKWTVQDMKTEYAKDKAFAQKAAVERRKAIADDQADHQPKFDPYAAQDAAARLGPSAQDLVDPKSEAGKQLAKEEKAKLKRRVLKEGEPDYRHL